MSKKVKPAKHDPEPAMPEVPADAVGAIDPLIKARAEAAALVLPEPEAPKAAEAVDAPSHDKLSLIHSESHALETPAQRRARVGGNPEGFQNSLMHVIK